MNRAQLDGWCEKTILGLVLAVLIYSPLATGAVEPQDFVVVQWLTIGVLVAWGIRWVINPELKLVWPAVCWPVLAFLAYAAARSLTAEVEFLARQELIKVLIYGGLFFAVLNNLRHERATHFLGLTLVIVALGVASYAIFQFITESEYVWQFLKPEGYRKRGSGTFVNPNHAAGYLEMILPLALAYTLRGRFGPLTKVFLGYASLVIFVGIAVTLSRAGWVATALIVTALTVWLVRKRVYRWQGWLMAGALVVLAAGFFFKANLPRNRYERLNLAASTEDYRFQLWPPAYRLWRDHFWFGAGPNLFDYRFRQYRPTDARLQGRPDRVHNDYLNTFVDWGFVGGALVFSAWAAFFAELFRQRKRIEPSPDDAEFWSSNRPAFVLGGTLGLVAILLHSWVDFNMHIPANAIVVVTLLALVSGNIPGSDSIRQLAVRPRRVLLVMTLLILFLAWQAMVATVETHWLSNANASRVEMDSLAALKRAFVANPKNFETAYRIGELLRAQSAEGLEDHQELAQEALAWFRKSIALNHYDPYGFIGAGMCLDLLKRYEEAQGYFDQAHKLDPNGYFTLAHLGWHYVQREDFREAKRWFETSLALRPQQNPIAQTYLAITNQRLAENPSKN